MIKLGDSKVGMELSAGLNKALMQITLAKLADGTTDADVAALDSVGTHGQAYLNLLNGCCAISNEALQSFQELLEEIREYIALVSEMTTSDMEGVPA